MIRHVFAVNGVSHEVNVGPGETLLTTLRVRLSLTGAKEACGVGECGACTVLIDGRARVACLTLTQAVSGEVETVEGLSRTAPSLQDAFAAEGGFQCGFCTPGQLMSCQAIARSKQGREPSEDSEDGSGERALRHQLSGNICRCTGYSGIVRALQREISRAHETPASGPNPTTEKGAS